MSESPSLGDVPGQALTAPVAAESTAANEVGAGGGPSAGRDRSGMLNRLWFDEFGVVAGLALLVVGIGIFHGNFLAKGNLVEVLRSAALVGPMVFGTVFLLSMGEIDLSIGSLYGLTVIVAAKLMGGGMNPWLAAGLGLAVGVGGGILNGLLANQLRVATIIVTLGTLSMFEGLTLTVSNGSSLTGLPQGQGFFTTLGGDLLGFPVSVWILVVTAVALTFVYRRTTFGMQVRAIGSNPQAAAFSGIPVKRIRLQALILMGLLCGVAGMLTLAFFASADPTLGTGQELEIIAAAIIGGTALSGGSGTVVGGLIGILIIQVINSGLAFFGIAANWGIFVTGAVIILAVAMDGLVRRRRAARVAKS